MYLIYDFLLLIYALIYLPYLLLTKRWYSGFGMRFGVFSSGLQKQIKAKTNIWVHAVSVGEVMVLDGFINRLSKEYPSYQIIASVTTKTGYELACERLKDKALIIPSPIDFSFVARGFVSLISPRMYLAVETEIWPNLYRQLSIQKIPIIVINGRISDNSFGRYKAIRFLLKTILNQVKIWCMQSQRDAQRIRDLGAEPLRVVVTGNVKFDDLPKTLDNTSVNLKGGNSDLWWVAGSTHPGEEEIVLDVYQKIRKEHQSWRLVIAPRHIERVEQVIGLINRKGFKVVKFSEINASNVSHDDVIIIDTIGHLRSLYAQASLVFVGKSLCVGGGHNIIEPALYGKPIVIGPRCENFRDIVACFNQANAIVQVEDAGTFEMAIKSLCADQSKRDALGLAARAVIDANQGATRRTIEHMAGIIK